MPKLPLTKEKARWLKNRKVAVRGTRLNYNAGQQERYVKELQKLVREMTKEALNEVTRLFKSDLSQEYFTEQKEAAALVQDASLSSQARILMNALMGKFTQLFDQKSKTLAERMVEGAAKLSKLNLYSSLKQLSGGLSLKTGVVPEGMEDVAKASIEENVSLIRSIPQQYFKDITGSVMRSITTGRGLADLVPEIKKYAGQTERRAKNIALDQTRKAYNSINKQRLLALNVKKFEWIHSGGGQVPRQSHLKMDGKIFSFENIYEEQANMGIPEEDRGIPGHAVNCKCTILPIIDFNSND